MIGSSLCAKSSNNQGIEKQSIKGNAHAATTDCEYARARTIEEAKQLVESGFEYVTDVEGVKLFKKRK